MTLVRKRLVFEIAYDPSEVSESDLNEIKREISVILQANKDLKRIEHFMWLV